MFNQIWKDIPTWQGIYKCSNYGRVYSYLKKKFIGYRKPDGYYQVNLSYNGRKQSWRIHRLVATVFQRPLLQTEDAHHKIKQLKCCNCIWNIEIKNKLLHIKEHKAGTKPITAGKPLSQETKQKISSALKGKPKSEETKQKMRSYKRGPMSQQQKRKISQSKKGIKFSTEHIKKREQTKKLKRLLDPNYGKRIKKV